MAIRLGSTVINCADIELMTRFWSQALGLLPSPLEAGGDFRVLRGDRSNISLQRSRTPVTARDQMHLDLYSDDQAAEVERLTGLGAMFVRHHEDPDDDYVVMADPEGNEFCVAAVASLLATQALTAQTGTSHGGQGRADQGAQQGSQEQRGCHRVDDVVRGRRLAAAAGDHADRHSAHGQREAAVQIPAIDRHRMRLSGAPGQDQPDRDAQDDGGAAHEGAYRQWLHLDLHPPSRTFNASVRHRAPWYGHKCRRLTLARTNRAGCLRRRAR
jgi:hypothetical protein